MPKYKLICEIKKFWRNKVAIWCHYFFLVFLFPKIFIYEKKVVSLQCN